MRKIILSLICLCCFTLAYSQHIHYQKSLDAALSQSAKSHKLVLVIIPPSILQGHTDIASALDSPQIARFFTDNFINYKYNENDTTAVSLLKTYPINAFPAYLFLDSNKNLVYKQMGSSLMSTIYLYMGQKAVSLSKSFRTLTNYNARYANGDRQIDFLKDYISLRQELGLMDDTKLIDQYVNLLSITALQDYSQVLFILNAGPVMYSDTYNLCFVNRKIVDSIYKTETVALRQYINHKIIVNTLNQAIATKNTTLAQQAASYQQSRWPSEYSKGALVFAQTMLNYYKAIKDTALFFPKASFFYDTFYMTISVDSAKKLLANKADPFMDYMKNTQIDTSKFKIKRTKATDPKPITKSITVVTRPVPPPLPGNVASVLNNAAYDFYTLGTRNQAYLTKAMLWSKRSIALNPTYHYYDTLAHLLYRLGFFAEAKYTQNKAIALARNGKAAPQELENLKLELNKINNKLL